MDQYLRSNCPCCSRQQAKNCCIPLIDGKTNATHPEALMRSRYSAYVLKRYDYIFKTYSSNAIKHQSLSIDRLKQSDDVDRWCHLQIIKARGDVVEFIAFYTMNNAVFCLHETSTFKTELGEWRYDRGVIHEDSGLLNISRNAVCFCGSGRKFKRCCGNI